MADAGSPLQVHEDESTPRAPGELELVRSFLSLHEHERGGGTASLPPTQPAMRWWLTRHDLVGPDEDPSDEELDAALELLEALRATILAPKDGPRVDDRAVGTIDAAARDAGLELRFGSGGPASIEPAADGVRGALGRVLSLAYLAKLDGRWDRFKECRSAECRAVFYDRSKNHSGRWCSMDSCGNRNKVRAWRERQEARGRDD
jgi:predicted RNA-binding Zn ribbon-like protein